jgi:hypothetical protein
MSQIELYKTLEDVSVTMFGTSGLHAALQRLVGPRPLKDSEMIAGGYFQNRRAE